MNFDLSDEQSMLRDTAARFVREQYGFEQRRALLAGKGGGSREHWQRFAEFGWLGLDIPEAFGGLECSFVETAVLMEQLGAGLVLEPMVAAAVLAARVLTRSGNTALCERWLPPLAAGEALLTLAHDEPEGHRAGPLPATQAVPEGEGYRVSGFKTMVVAGPLAHQLLVSARLSRGETGDLAVFLVDRSAPGLRLDPYRLVDGRACADVSLDAVRCAAQDLVAAGPAARDALEDALDRARVAAMAEALGGIDACVELTGEYLKMRSQFGQPLSKFQSLQHLMADMFVDAQESRSILYRALAHLDADAPVRRRAVAAAQLVIGQAGRRVAANGVQMHGGYGVTEEYRISHHFRQLFVLEKLYGDVPDTLARMAWVD